MEAGVLAVAGGGGTPFAAFHHPTLFGVGDEFGAALALVGGGGGVVVGPLQTWPLEVLHVGAVGARHEVAALVPLEEHALDAAEVLDGGGGAGDDFAVPVILGAADAELDLVAFRTSGLGVAVGFVEEDDAAADTAEAAGGVGANQAERSTGELLLQDGVGAVLGLGFAD